MARADRRRVRSAKSHAGTRTTRRRDSDLAAIEDTLFFTRIRQHAKWVFVFLALSFLHRLRGLQRRRLGKRRRHRRASPRRRKRHRRRTSPSRTRARRCRRTRRARRHSGTSRPRSRATAQTDEAIVALTRYVELKPKDQDALRELAGLHLGQGSKFAQEAQIAQLRASYDTFGSTFSSPLDLGKGATIGPDPIDQAIATRASEAVNDGLHQGHNGIPERRADLREARRARAEGPEHPARARPGGAAERRLRARRSPRIRRFLKLAPDDPSAAIVKQQIAQLKAAQASPSSG